MLENIQKRATALLSVIVVSVIVVGCGGSSNGSSAKELLVITEENSEEVLATVGDAFSEGVNFEDDTNPLGTQFRVNPSIVKSTQKLALKSISSATNLKTLAESGSYQCSGGGDVSYSGTEFSGTITYNNCQEYDATLNGTVSFNYSNETTGNMTFTNFSITDSNGNESVWTSLVYAFTNTTMSLVMSGYSMYDVEKVEFENYDFTLTYVNDETISLSLSGMIKTDCLGSWIEIQTNEAIQSKLNENCPSSGQVVVEGGSSSITIDFNADGSLDVSGSVSEHYDSCDALDSGICAI